MFIEKGDNRLPESFKKKKNVVLDKFAYFVRHKSLLDSLFCADGVTRIRTKLNE